MGLSRVKVTEVKVDTKGDRPSAPCPFDDNWSLSGNRKREPGSSQISPGKSDLGTVTHILAMFPTEPAGQTDGFYRIPNSGPTWKSSLPAILVEALLFTAW